jgi:GT2 family glycosyltransferase
MRADAQSAPRLCDISVVIPTRNRPQRLARCVAALSKQTFPRDRFEVIVVNDGGVSVDAALAPWRDQLRLRTLDRRHAGPAAARNAGAAVAGGMLLAFTDDDCEPLPDWLTECVNCLHETPDRAIGGQTQNALHDNAYASASQLLVDYLYECHGATDGASRAQARMPAFVTSNNLAVRADMFRRLGGFDESFTLAAAEDRDFCERWQEHGFELARVPSAVVRHAHPLTFASFWRQHVNYGRGAHTLRRLRASRGATSAGLEPLSFYVGLLRYPLQTSSARSPILIMLLMVSQLANAFGFAIENARSTAASPRT